ncbi:MAG: toll/interleukin-1 receptor domain-containing protein [Bryobacteraceae bacterium]
MSRKLAQNGHGIERATRRNSDFFPPPGGVQPCPLRFTGRLQRGRNLAYNKTVQKLSVFLSHVTVESKLADIIKKHLVRDFIGLLEVFESSDRLSIPAGKKWLSEVTTALRKADLHVILCSDESKTRPWIHFEAGAAHLRDIPIIPLCHSGLIAPQLPVPLSEYEGLQVGESAGLVMFYRALADALGSSIPEIDFEAFANEVKAFESEYQQQRQLIAPAINLRDSVETIRNPKVLCISSPQFAQLGYENQLQTVLSAFPDTVPHQRVFSSAELRRAFEDEQSYDIVHIAAYVCPRSGDLYFSDVDLRTGRGASANPDVLNADALAALLQMAHTRLVVIGSCDSIALAATLVSTCHVVAARDLVSAKMMAAWVEAFYGKLPRRSLSQALEFAQKISQAPMRFYVKQPKSVDLVFTQEAVSSAAVAVV